MKRDGYFSFGEFAKLAHVTKKTLRLVNSSWVVKTAYKDETSGDGSLVLLFR